MKVNMSRPKEFYIKIIVILFIILMTVLVFVKFRKDNNPDRITEEQKNAIFRATVKGKILIKRLKRMISKALKYIIETLIYSDFNIEGTELEFGVKGDYEPIILNLENGKKIEITGKIDRVDIAKTAEGNYIRIIDYKSSIKNIDLNEVEAGLQLQLLTYVDAICKKEKTEPAGALYFSLIEPIIKSSEKLTEEQIEEEIKKQFKMNGLILADVNIVKKMDKTLENGNSKIIPAYINKEGNLSDKPNSVNREQFERLQKYTMKLLEQISESILTGNINIKPYYSIKKKSSYC